VARTPVPARLFGVRVNVHERTNVNGAEVREKCARKDRTVRDKQKNPPPKLSDKPTQCRGPRLGDGVKSGGWNNQIALVQNHQLGGTIVVIQGRSKT